MIKIENLTFVYPGRNKATIDGMSLERPQEACTGSSGATAWAKARCCI